MSFSQKGQNPEGIPCLDLGFWDEILPEGRRNPGAIPCPDKLGSLGEILPKGAESKGNSLPGFRILG